MPFSSVTLRPGVNTEATPTLNEAGYAATALGRFRAGLFEKLGGWTRYYPFDILGTTRALHAWQDLSGTGHLAVGATTRFSVVTGTQLANLTPQILSASSQGFATTTGTVNVTITETGVPNLTIYDAVEFLTPVSVGGIILSGSYKIDLVLSSTSYQLTAASAALTGAVATLPAFATTNGSFQVDVTLPSHKRALGDTVNFGVSTSLGGVAISGNYPVVAVASANVFSIYAANAATSTTTGTINGGATLVNYLIAIGPLPASSGYSVGTYSDGTYSVGQAQSGTIGTPIIATNWTVSNWGSFLMACPQNGAVYYWDPVGNFSTLVPVGSAPFHSTGIFVSTGQQILVTYGSTQTNAIGISQDPLLVKWSTSGDYTNFTVSSQTQAGSQRLTSGSRIVGALSSLQQNLLWTDIGLWAMAYIGPPLVFGFNEIGFGCGLVGAHAAAKMGASVYWMSQSNFYELSAGGPQVIPCTVWDAVFQNANQAQISKCHAAADTPFNEIWWFYPSASATECDSYVKFNTLERTWDYGLLARSAWIDQSLLGTPIGAAPLDSGATAIFQHESGRDADGAGGLTSSFTTGYFYIGEGEEFCFIDQVLPDMKWAAFVAGNPLTPAAAGAQVQFTFYTVDFPGDTPSVAGPYTVTQATNTIDVRLRGRQMAVKVESSDAGSFWRIGKIRYRFAPDGRR